VWLGGLSEVPFERSLEVERLVWPDRVVEDPVGLGLDARRERIGDLEPVQMLIGERLVGALATPLVSGA